ncbi:MAG: hypothetical protein EOM80_05375 [Erysipelotrichia bacterium]|nr:hypothetical protein [Erysipelotrichia bacterium]
MNIRNFELLFLSLLLLIYGSADLFACDGSCQGVGCNTASMAFAMPRSSITADTLVNLMNSGAKVALVECRSGEQKEDLRIPGAIIARDNEPEETIFARLPSKDTMLILYPGLEGGNIASMTESLRKLGYLSILEYRDGVYGWITFGYEPAKGELP